jgi:SSS family solute:Na+ symporter
MHLIDWILVGGCLLIVLAVGIYAQQYMGGVADFLSAGRSARRYLLAVSRGEMSSGAVVFVATFEVMAHSGFTIGWWTWLTGPIGIFIGIVGFVTYRYRETRALTLAQFFEIRYSKAFRLFAGILGFFAGILNFGIIPAIGARFMVYIFGVAPSLHFMHVVIPTYILLMAGFLLIDLFVTLAGGLITIMLTSCIEGIVAQAMYLILIFGLLSIFSWSEISTTLEKQPPGQSFLNPMDTGSLKDFNIWYVVMGTFLGIYGTMAWQNRSAYNSAPLNAHEGRMGGLMGGLRGMGTSAVVTLLALCGYTYLHHVHFAAGASQVYHTLAQIPNPQLREQMEIPVAVTYLLPAGLKGALCVVLLLGIFGGDSSHLHSWGSLFVQDIILPYRKKPLTPRQHIWYLRLAITGVALFAFLFGVLVPPSDYIQMWFAITQGIFAGGAGAAIIGGLYWKKGTTAGAWAGMLSGSSLSVAGILARQYYGDAFPLNGLQISFCASMIAVILYVVISLLTNREDFNMNRMLHRGAYADVPVRLGEQPVPNRKPVFSLERLIGIDEHFSLGDKWIAGGLFGWSVLFSLIMIVGTIWNLASPWPISVWSTFWHVVAVVIPVFFAVVIGIWFTWGGIADSLALFRSLRAEKFNPLDNGMVVGGQNLDETKCPEPPVSSSKFSGR